MNKFYNNEDDFLRHQLTNHEFDALPQAWEQMSALLDSQPVVARRSAGYYWWGLSIAALLFGATSGVYYYNSKNFPATNPQPATAIATSTPMASMNQPGTSFSNKNQPSVVPSAEQTTPVFSTNTTVATSPIAPAVQQQSSNNTMTTASAPNAHSTSSNNTTAITNKDKDNNLHINNWTTTSPSPIGRTANANTIAAATTATNPNKEQNIALVSKTPVTTSKILTEEQQRRIKKTRTEIIYQYSTTPLKALQEKRRQAVGTFGIKEEVDFKKSPIKFGVTVGASTQLPAISPQKVAFRPVLGAQVSGQFAKRHHIQVGAQYKNLAVDTDAPVQNSTYTGDNNQSQHQSHQIRGINLIEFPVVYKVHPHPKYNLQAGVKPAVVLGVNSDAKQRVDLRQANLGLSSWDLGVLLGAEYCLNKNWSIGIQYTLGLFNMAQNAQPLHDQQQVVNNLSSDPLPAQSINKDNELLVPIGNTQGTAHYIRVPKQIKNSDLQLLLKYNF
ncbi:MAG: outer membrane beta-barrel protein [Aureispira sp.]